MIEKIDSFVAKIVNYAYINTNGSITPFLKFITNLGKAGILYIIIVAILLIFKKTRKQGIVIGVAVFISVALCYILKYSVSRPRPYTLENSLYYKYWVQTGKTIESSFSFPSGHTTCASALAFALLFLTKKKYRYLYLIIPVVMAYTRIYFSVHYFTDCLTGLFIGLLGAFVSIKIYNCFIIKRPNNNN